MIFESKKNIKKSYHSRKKSDLYIKINLWVPVMRYLKQKSLYAALIF